jgi:hypothetical protein
VRFVKGPDDLVAPGRQIPLVNAPRCASTGTTQVILVVRLRHRERAAVDAIHDPLREGLDRDVTPEPCVTGAIDLAHTT